MIKDYSNKKSSFRHFLNNIGILNKGKLVSTNYPLCDAAVAKPPFCSNTYIERDLRSFSFTVVGIAPAPAPVSCERQASSATHKEESLKER